MLPSLTYTIQALVIIIHMCNFDICPKKMKHSQVISVFVSGSENFKFKTQYNIFFFNIYVYLFY